MRRVPHELWEEIFSICVAEQRFQAESDSKKMEETKVDVEWRTMFVTPFRLAGVCLRWRTIVTSTPALWSSVFYNLDWADREPALSLYLERSGERDLDIFLCDVQRSDLSRQSHSVQEERVDRSGALAFQMLLDRMPRIQGFLVVSPALHLPFPDTQPFNCSFERLRSFNVRAHPEYPSWFFEAVSQAPFLEQLVVPNDMFRENPFNRGIAMNPMVKYLELSDVEGECLNAIMNLQHLESLKIETLRSCRPIEAARSTLRRLTIDNGDREVLEILQSVEMPHLQSLHVPWLSDDPSPDHTLLVLSKFSSVQHFSLLEGSEYFRTGRLVNFLRHLPNLVTFRFGAGYEDPADIEDASATLCTFLSYLVNTPHRLETLSLSLLDVSITNETCTALIRLVEAWTQKRTIPSLKYIYLLAAEFPKRGWKKLASQLQASEGQGFEWVVGNKVLYSEMFQEDREHGTITIQAAGYTSQAHFDMYRMSDSRPQIHTISLVLS
ncbi:hypothetical protein AAF712_012565 [Marasmius tenuissimus]|uniref:F-box domain-containing protein n=1 Tax=Marasmius tenuissimus TaxID=585030 RepID=A0ABR2ZH94_9AGAR